MGHKKHKNQVEENKAVEIVEPPSKGRAAVQKAGKVIRCLLFCAVLSVVLFGVCRLVESKSGVQRFRPFLNEEVSPDVLFFGTSHVIDGVYPLELWNDYGIVSYNLGASQSTLPMTYWNIMQALEHSDPKLIVVDCSGLRLNMKTPESFSMVNWAYDAYPLTKTKYNAVMDLLDDPYVEEAIKNGELTQEQANQKSAGSILFNLIAYHGRWEYLTSKDYDITYNDLKGASCLTDVAENNTFPTIDYDKVLEEETTAMRYLGKIIDLCRAKGIELLLTYIPFSANITRQKEAHTAAVIAGERSVDYIDFLSLGIVDYTTDSADVGSHLNASGAKKITDYLGSYIMEHYDIQDHRDDPEYSSWDDNYNRYTDYKINTLKGKKNLESYLMLLKDKSFDAVIEVGNSHALKIGLVPNLLSNLGVNVDDFAEDTEFILIRGGQESTILYECRGDGETQDTVLGAFTSYLDENNITRYRLGELELGSEEEIDRKGDVLRISVMKSGNTEETVDSVEFSYSESAIVSGSAKRAEDPKEPEITDSVVEDVEEYELDLDLTSTSSDVDSAVMGAEVEPVAEAEESGGLLGSIKTKLLK